MTQPNPATANRARSPHHPLNDAQQQNIARGARAVFMPDNLLRRRLLFGYSQQDIAAALGCKRDTVREWESGRIMPSGDSLLRLMLILDLGVGDIMAYSRGTG